MSLYLHFLGTPFAEAEGARVSVPLRKAEALLFYVAFEGRVQRERLKLLFWNGKDEAQASNNLRNALYLLRRAIPQYLCVDRRYVATVGVVRDFDNADGLTRLGRTIDPRIFEEPMRDFDTLGLGEFENWLIAARSEIRGRIAASLRRRVAACYEAGLCEDLTESLQALLAFDPFDEDSVMELMEAYCNIGNTAKAVALYASYRERLGAELGISPGERAEALYGRILGPFRDKCPADERQPFFCCREKEMRRIGELAAGDGEGGEQSLFVLVHGEAGVGKTALVDHAVALTTAADTPIFRTRPLSIGEAHPYSSWYGAVSDLAATLHARGIGVEPAARAVLAGTFPDFMLQDAAPGGMIAPPKNPLIVARILSDLVRRVSSSARTVFVFEDLHWFDAESLLLLKAFLSETGVPATVFFTARPEREAWADEMLRTLRTARPYRYEAIPLTPFRPDEVARFCRAAFPEAVIESRGEDYFVRESDGMPLLLVEMQKMLRDNPEADCSAGLRGVVMGRMEDLTPLQRDVLSALSVFGKDVGVADLASVMDVNAQTLIEPIERLLAKRLVQEAGNGDRLDFSHANVRDCVYGTIPKLRRKSLHRRVAETLNASFSPQIWNPGLTSAVRHHFTLAGEPRQVLAQHLREMGFRVALNHVLFPLVRDDVLLSCRIPYSGREETEGRIREAGELLAALDRSAADRERLENRRLEASYLEIWGGYLVNWGEYREGRALLQRALRLVNRHGFRETHVYCLEHMGHYFLQTDGADRLRATGREILRLARGMGEEPHVGLALRFIGVACAIERDFARAEKIFARAAEVFEELAMAGKDYTLNMLAPRCYIGEIRQWQGDAEAAMAHFDACIEKCLKKNLFWGRSHFHAHAADVAYDLKDWRLFRRHVADGIALFERTRGGHCGSLLYSLRALDAARQGLAADAVQALRTADGLASIGKNSWCAAQWMAKAFVSRMMERRELDDGDGLRAYFDSASGAYAEAAEMLYRRIGAETRAASIRREFCL